MDKEIITKEEIAKITHHINIPSHIGYIVVPSYIGYMELCGYRFPIYKREDIPTKEQQEHLKHTFGITFCLNAEGK